MVVQRSAAQRSAALVGRENIRLPLARAAAVLATTESTRLRQQGPRIATTAREAQ